MPLDSLTLLAVSGVIAVLCGMSFVLNTAFGRNDATGRMWSVGFIAAILGGISLTIYAMSPSTWFALIVGNGALPLALGAMWSGARLYNGKTSRFVVVGIVAAFVAGAVIVRGPDAGGWAGAVEFNLGVAALALCAAVEMFSRRLKRNVNARIASVVFWLVGCFYAARSVALVVDGHDGTFFTTVFGTSTVTFVNTLLLVTLSIALSTLRAERAAGAVGDFTTGIHSAAGVLSAAAFAQAAVDHLDRAEYAPGGAVPLALIAADIDNLPEFNIAFGRAAGDQAIARFASTLRRTAPVMSVVGHPAAGRFLILAEAANHTEARALAARLQSSLVDTPLEHDGQIRFTASFSVALTGDYSHDLGTLTTAVTDTLEAVKTAGGNDIVVATNVH
ncbi:GGDEF domain-containing protein [Leifsonia sp. YAF41]|uniref:GGDEF domain-containing protein n=1 Tax=Leifsonia sp. YAF41 TaxID=3233086 RepID=UPI003F9C763E